MQKEKKIILVSIAVIGLSGAAVYLSALYNAVRDAPDIVARVTPWLDDVFEQFVKDWEPENALSIFSPFSFDERSINTFKETWRGYSKRLGPLKHFQPPACSHGIEVAHASQLHMAELTKCFINASFERSDATMMVDLNENGKTWEITQFSVLQTNPPGRGANDSSFELVQAGIFEKPTAPSIPGRLVRASTSVPARKGIVFGIAYQFRQNAGVAQRSYRVVWRTPSGGLFNPHTKTPAYAYMYTVEPHQGPNTLLFGLDEAWEVVSGTWALDVWHDETRLYHQVFHIVSEN